MPQHKGAIPWNKGKPWSLETKQKLSNSHKGKKLSDEHKEKIGLGNRGKKKPPRSKIHSEHIGEAMKKQYRNGRVSPFKKIWDKNPNFLRGENNYRWKGGITRRCQHTQDKKYIKWRTSVFERDNWTCQTCGFRGYVEPHHIKPWSKYPEFRYNINNGVTLCRECHKLTFKDAH